MFPLRVSRFPFHLFISSPRFLLLPAACRMYGPDVPPAGGQQKKRNVSNLKKNKAKKAHVYFEDYHPQPIEFILTPPPPPPQINREAPKY